MPRVLKAAVTIYRHGDNQAISYCLTPVELHSNDLALGFFGGEKCDENSKGNHHDTRKRRTFDPAVLSSFDYNSLIVIVTPTTYEPGT